MKSGGSGYSDFSGGYELVVRIGDGVAGIGDYLMEGLCWV